MNKNGIHLASYLVVTAIIIIIIRLIFKKSSRPNKNIASAGKLYLYSFVSGVLLVNGLVHFLHGASGENFPAPFSFMFTQSFLKHLPNVIWGIINLAISYNLVVKFNVFRSRKQVSAFFIGLFTMGVILCYIFS